MGELIPQEVVAELLGVEVRTLRQWRTSDFQESKLYLPTVKKNRTSKSFYRPEVIFEFLNRNPSYKDRVLAAFAPVEIQQRIQALRGALVELPTLRPLLPPSDDDIAAGHSWFGQPAHSHDHHNGDSTK